MNTDQLMNKLALYRFSGEETHELMQYEPILLEHALKLVDRIKPQRVYPYLLKICEQQNVNPDRELIKLRAQRVKPIGQSQLQSFDGGQPVKRQYEPPPRLDYGERRRLRLRRINYSLSVVEQGSNAERILLEDRERLTRELEEYDQNQTETKDNGLQASTIPQQL